MEKEFTPYELALKLKELGFDEMCLGYYRKPELLKLFNLEKYKGVNQDIENTSYIKAPLWQQVFDFFRCRYNLNSEIQPQRGESLKWDYIIFNMERQAILNMEELNIDTYEEARLECLKKLITLVQ